MELHLFKCHCPQLDEVCSAVLLLLVIYGVLSTVGVLVISTEGWDEQRVVFLRVIRLFAALRRYTDALTSQWQGVRSRFRKNGL
jgi:hypothetical protein